MEPIVPVSMQGLYRFDGFADVTITVDIGAFLGAILVT
jgi:hypothetical protein